MTIDFSYRDSYGNIKTESKPELTPDEIVQMVSDRMKRFDSTADGARESDSSRSERKYVMAHSSDALRSAKELMDKDQREEFDEMETNYNNKSDLTWLKENSTKSAEIMDDEGRPMNGSAQESGNSTQGYPLRDTTESGL